MYVCVCGFLCMKLNMNEMKFGRTKQTQIILRVHELVQTIFGQSKSKQRINIQISLLTLYFNRTCNKS